jgi:hypothetical protein
MWNGQQVPQIDRQKEQEKANQEEGDQACIAPPAEGLNFWRRFNQPA